MARAETEVVQLGKTEPPPAPEARGTAASAPSVRTVKALELTDAQGRRALAWRKGDTWVVECDDRSFKRRLQRALRKPVWVRDDVAGPDGERWSTLVELHAGDPRHARQLFWNWHQLGLPDVQVDVVPAPTPAHAAATA